MEQTLGSLAERLEHLSARIDRMKVAPGCGCDSGCPLKSPPPEALAAGGDDRCEGVRTKEPKAIGASWHAGARKNPPPAVGAEFVEAVMRSRRRRTSFLESDLLFDPAWAMLLDLFSAALRNKRLSVTAVLIGSGVPDTTALRYLRVLEKRGHVERVPDEKDKRRVFVKITKPAFEGMAAYFAALEADTLAILPRRAAQG